MQQEQYYLERTKIYEEVDYISLGSPFEHSDNSDSKISTYLDSAYVYYQNSSQESFSNVYPQEHTNVQQHYPTLIVESDVNNLIYQQECTQINKFSFNIQQNIMSYEIQKSNDQFVNNDQFINNVPNFQPYEQFIDESINTYSTGCENPQQQYYIDPNNIDDKCQTQHEQQYDYLNNQEDYQQNMQEQIQYQQEYETLTQDKLKEEKEQEEDQEQEQEQDNIIFQVEQENKVAIKKVVKYIRKKPAKKNKKEEIVRDRKKIVRRKLPQSDKVVEVKEKDEQKRRQLKNHLKNYLKKCIPYLLEKLENITNFSDEQKQMMKLTLESSKNKTTKNDVLYLIKSFEDFMEMDEIVFRNLLQQKISLEKKKQDECKAKFDTFYRAFRFLNSRMINKDSFQEFQSVTYNLNLLNQFNRCSMLRFCLIDYIPIILYTKADKEDQLFTKNYILNVISNPQLIE